jgi:hypothetical protein
VIGDLIGRLRMVRHLRGIVAACLVALVGAGFSAQATLGDRLNAGAVAPPPATGYEADDHFPGAAYFFVGDQDAAPGAGTTGTADLPDMPIPAGAEQAGLDATIHPAAVFSMGSATPLDRARALQCLTTAIYYEAAREPDEGQRAVAQVILNRVRHPAFPNTVCGVVYQGSEKRGCQFSFACDGALARSTPNRDYWIRAARVANAALSGQVLGAVGLATHYHTFAVTPAWNRGLVMTAAIGAHFFHRWQGYWGTPAAFSQVYRGNEPVPGPHPAAAPLVPEAIAALTVPPVPAEGLKPLTPLPADQIPALPAAAAAAPRADAGPKPRPSPTAEQPLPESTILDRWKDTGRPLK